MLSKNLIDIVFFIKNKNFVMYFKKILDNTIQCCYNDYSQLSKKKQTKGEGKMKKQNVEKVLKEKSKIVGDYINSTEGFDVFTVTQILRKKAQLEELKKATKEVESEYNNLRDVVLSQIETLQNSKYDTVDVVIDNMRAKKYPKNNKAGQIQEEEMKKLAREKKLIGKLYEKKLVLNEQKLLEAIENGLITDEEFISVTIQAISPVLEVSYVNEKTIEKTETSETETNENKLA